MSGASRGIVSNFSFAQALRKLCALATAESTSAFAGLVAAVPLGILQIKCMSPWLSSTRLLALKLLLRICSFLHLVDI